MPLAKRGLEKGRKEVTGGELKRIKGSSSGALPPPALPCPESKLEQNHYPELPPFQLSREHEGGRSPAPGRLEWLPAPLAWKFNFYLRTIPTLLVRCRQHCHYTRPLDSSYVPPHSPPPCPSLDPPWPVTCSLQACRSETQHEIKQ